MRKFSSWKLLEAMDWDVSDNEPASPSPSRNSKRPPPTPIRSKSKPVTTRRLPGVSSEGIEDFDNRAWNVTNRKTGQVFNNIPGKTPMDAKNHVLKNNPSLQGIKPWDLAADPMEDGGVRADQDRTPQPRAQQTQAPVQPNAPAPSPNRSSNQAFTTPTRGSRFTKNDPYSFDSDDETTLANPPRSSSPSTMAQTVQVKKVKPKAEGSNAACMGSNAPVGSDEDAFTEAVVRNTVKEIVRKKAGGGGYQLYAPNKGKKKSPKPVGEFPTRLAAKNAELARFPPKDPEQLKRMRARLEKIKKDPKKRAKIERDDLSGRKKSKKSGAPAHDRKKRQESFVHQMSNDLYERLFGEANFGLGKSGQPKHPSDLEDSPSRQGNHLSRSSAYDRKAPDRNPKKSRRDHMNGRPVTERLFHEDEIPGSPWDEKMTALHPDAISSDKKLHALHRSMEKASIGALGDAHRGLSKVLRGMVKVNPGDISFDADRKKTFMPIMMDCDGYEIGPVHLYVDGGHIKIEVSKEAREAIAQLEPDTARDLRGGLMSFEEDHLPKICGAQKAWAERDSYLDKLHSRLEKHAAGLSGVEHHLMKSLLTKAGKRK